MELRSVIRMLYGAMSTQYLFFESAILSGKKKRHCFQKYWHLAENNSTQPETRLERLIEALLNGEHFYSSSFVFIGLCMWMISRELFKSRDRLISAHNHFYIVLVHFWGQDIFFFTYPFKQGLIT